MNREAEDTFRDLFQAVYDDLLCFVERRSGPAVAEDVVSETFLVAWRRLHDVPDSLDGARAWLFTVAHNLLRNRQRSEQRQQNVALRILRQPEGPAAGDADAVAAHVDLTRAWQRLSPADQEALALTAIEDLTGPQAAHVLGITRTAFSLRLLRARRNLRRHLRHQPAPSPAISRTASHGGPA
ncbi:RNA polymerase sigma factor [Actinoplanes friuliensis]|uniref:Putative RNA polymerase ECF-subfamily sigma factor n=1 Tax=Actinoplanes friuliensis DSM 7358 TaxID=1246995 RepID=U5VYY0_9ACTN|nr:RNA polymerase sigma factor [Actinoplanes friuliensis]AGZ40940.1 putative RNA polymerase ECF-subfamily sigma factor [Actinoplanes friuliensis DSM 7358]